MAHDTCVLLADDVGLAVLRFRLSLWTRGKSATWPSCTCGPAPRTGDGAGPAGSSHRGGATSRADHMDPGTTEDDVAARHLYEKCDSDVPRGRRPVMFVRAGVVSTAPSNLGHLDAARTRLQGICARFVNFDPFPRHHIWANREEILHPRPHVMAPVPPTRNSRDNPRRACHAEQCAEPSPTYRVRPQRQTA